MLVYGNCLLTLTWAFHDPFFVRPFIRRLFSVCSFILILFAIIFVVLLFTFCLFVSVGNSFIIEQESNMFSFLASWEKKRNTNSLLLTSSIALPPNTCGRLNITRGISNKSTQNYAPVRTFMSVYIVQSISRSTFISIIRWISPFECSGIWARYNWQFNRFSWKKSSEISLQLNEFQGFVCADRQQFSLWIVNDLENMQHLFSLALTRFGRVA